MTHRRMVIMITETQAEIFIMAGIALIIALVCFALFFNIMPLEQEQGERFAAELCQDSLTEEDKAFCEDRETNQYR